MGGLAVRWIIDTEISPSGRFREPLVQPDSHFSKRIEGEVMKSTLAAIAIAFTLASIPVWGQSPAPRTLAAREESRPLPMVSAPQSAHQAATSVSESHSPGAAAEHKRVGIVSDWTQHHVLFPATSKPEVLARLQKDPRWTQAWYRRHREAWWPGSPRKRLRSSAKVQRDWTESLGTDVSIGPIYDPGFTTPDPGSGETDPAKYTWDITASPYCENEPEAGDSGDYVAFGIPASAALNLGSGGQANIIGYNNLYTNADGTGYCPTLTAPTVLFAYASGTGEVPAAISISLDGTKLAYIEDIVPTLGDPDGAAYFHVLTWVAGEGTGATDPATPDTGNDLSVQLIPPSAPSVIQSSTAAPFIDYTSDSAYVTTYSWATDSGYIYKISPVFGGGTPAIVWAAAIGAVPSSPVYDSISSNIFFTDPEGGIGFVTDLGGSPSAVTFGGPYADGNTSLNPPVVDSVNGWVYATFENPTDGAVVVQAATDLSNSSTVTFGKETAAVTGPYNVDFNDYYYGLSSGDTTETSQLMFVAAMDASTGTVPTLYTVPFIYDKYITSTGVTSTALATGPADSSPVTEFYNTTTSTDQLFVGVTDYCIATGTAYPGGGTGGCVMSFDITGTSFDSSTTTWTDAPSAGTLTTAIAADGGPTGMVVDNDADTTDYPEASSIYYATMASPSSLVKATQNGLN
jgi:hypothetical protein